MQVISTSLLETVSAYLCRQSLLPKKACLAPRQRPGGARVGSRHGNLHMYVVGMATELAYI